ncbi:MAG: type IV pilin protein [Rubrivivax sp.]|nr:type IV pilin protein [Rubrivivax sp.]
MMLKSAPNRPRHAQRAFTLIELMVAVVVVALLASVALPSFMDSIRKSRRSEAFAALSAVQQAQERWRGNNASYTTALANTAASGSPPNGLGLPATTSSGYYTVALSDATATGYKVTATAVAGKSQADDGICVRLRIEMAGGNIVYGSATAAGAFDTSANNRCWAR